MRNVKRAKGKVDGAKGIAKEGANTRSDGQAETYKVWVKAKDKVGNQNPEPGELKEGVSFSVQAPLKPEEPPF
ncbi:MAG: hypothetical protein RMK18_11960 [Armatimonadota bacterium]|nr:hypothetical protein [Armatimonadota bacterium]MDW8026562.1 hypothetical protein [Armatimonadota bacterium]